MIILRTHRLDMDVSLWILGNVLRVFDCENEQNGNPPGRANDFPFKKNAFSVSHLVNSVFFPVSAHFVHPELD